MYCVNIHPLIGMLSHSCLITQARVQSYSEILSPGPQRSICQSASAGLPPSPALCTCAADVISSSTVFVYGVHYSKETSFVKKKFKKKQKGLFAFTGGIMNFLVDKGIFL